MTEKIEAPDLDRLEALARAADPHGAVHLHTDYRHRADVKAEEAWRRAATPAAVSAVIALARRAKPEGESLKGHIVSVDVSTGEHDAGNRIFAELTGETGSDGTTLLAIEQSRNFSKPEGEAPQASTEGYLIDPGAGSAMDRVCRQKPNAQEMAEIVRRGGSVKELIVRPPAAQQAESGALPITRSTYGSLEACEAERERRAALAAQSQGAQAPTDEEIIAAVHACGVDTHPSKYDLPALQVEATSVPVIRDIYMKLATRAALAAKAEAPAVVFANDGREPDWQGYADAERAQQAAAPGALDADLRGWFDEWQNAMDNDARRALEAIISQRSAPGTPEAPKPPFPISDDEMAALRRFWECATDGEGYDVDKSMMQRLAEMGLVQRKSGAYYMATEFGLYVLGEYTMERAAQLDGGQEGSES